MELDLTKEKQTQLYALMKTDIQNKVLTRKNLVKYDAEKAKIIEVMKLPEYLDKINKE
jgi:hypothetical protein